MKSVTNISGAFTLSFLGKRYNFYEFSVHTQFHVSLSCKSFDILIKPQPEYKVTCAQCTLFFFK